MLYSARRREQELAQREAAGESFWTESFDSALRTKLVFAFRDSLPEQHSYIPYEVVRGLLVRHLGVQYLVRSSNSDQTDVEQFLMAADDEFVPDVLEAMAEAHQRSSVMQLTGNWNGRRDFDIAVAELLRRHRMSFDMIDGQMVPFSSRELHESVVQPTLSLLAGEPRFDKVESAYRKALEEISRGDGPDAITDAGTALQELLLALGCQGNALGNLIKDATRMGLIEAHHVKLLDWVSAERSQSGDTHAVTDAGIDDAWLIVHVMGAVALRLSKLPSVPPASAAKRHR